MNKPFLENVYNSSVQAAERNAGIPGTKQNAWSTYIRTIAMQQYSGRQFKDSDFFKQKIIYEDVMAESIKTVRDFVSMISFILIVFTVFYFWLNKKVENRY